MERAGSQGPEVGAFDTFRGLEQLELTAEGLAPKRNKLHANVMTQNPADLQNFASNNYDQTYKSVDNIIKEKRQPMSPATVSSHEADAFGAVVLKTQTSNTNQEYPHHGKERTSSQKSLKSILKKKKSAS